MMEAKSHSLEHTTTHIGHNVFLKLEWESEKAAVLQRPLLRVFMRLENVGYLGPRALGFPFAVANIAKRVGIRAPEVPFHSHG